MNIDKLTTKKTRRIKELIHKKSYDIMSFVESNNPTESNLNMLRP